MLYNDHLSSFAVIGEYIIVKYIIEMLDATHKESCIRMLLLVTIDT